MSVKKAPDPARNPGWFAKGKSGNLNGRPPAKSKPTSHAAALDIIMNKTLQITRNGIERKISAEEGLQHRTYQDAVAGKRLAQREVLRWITKREAWRANRRIKETPKVIVQKQSPDPDNADDALVLLAIAGIDLDTNRPTEHRLQLLLEPWAVKAALARRRGATALTDRDLEEFRRSTRDAKSLRWPRGDD